MKKLFIFLFVTILSCNTTSVNKQYINDSNSNITTPKNNKSENNNISNNNNLITDKYEILYNSVKEGLELYGCDAYQISNFSKLYSEFENKIKETSNFKDFSANYLDRFRKAFLKNSIEEYKLDSFYCYYCESYENFTKNIKIDLSEVKQFFVKNDGTEIFISTSLNNLRLKEFDSFSGKLADGNNTENPQENDLMNEKLTVKRKTIYIIDKLFIKPLKIGNRIFSSCRMNEFYYNKDTNKFFINQVYQNNTSFQNNTNSLVKENFYLQNIDILEIFTYINYNNILKIYTSYFDKYIKILDGRYLTVDLYLNNTNNQYYKLFKEVFITYLNGILNYEKIKVILIKNKIYINVEPYLLTKKLKKMYLKNLIEIDFSSKEITEDLKSLSLYVKFNENVIVEDNLIQEITDMKANSKGEIIILDNINKIIWRVVPFKLIEKIAGKRINYKNGDKNILNFINPEFIDIDKDDNIYVLDKGRKEILKIPDDRKLEEKKNYSIFYKQFGDKVKVKIDEHQNYDH